MAPTTAISLLILGVALFRHARKPWRGAGLMAVVVLVALVAVLGLLVVAGIGTSLQDRLFPSQGAIGGFPIGRMSLASGATFVAAGLGACLLLLRSRSSRLAPYVGQAASTLGVVAALAGATFLLSYLYRTPLLYRGTTVLMAATTALAFVFLGTALVAAAGPACFPLRYLTGDSTSARLSRVFLPLTVSVVLVTGAVSHLASASPAVNDPLILAALALVVAAITASLIAGLAHAIGVRLDEASRKLREGQELLSQFVLRSPIYAYIKRVTPTESRVVHASSNFQQMIGIARPDIVGKTMADLLPPELAAKVTADDWNAVANGDVLVLEEELYGRQYTSIKFPVPQSGGDLLAGYAIDITDRKRAEQERDAMRAKLLQAQKAESLGRMAGAIAHHYNNLLGATLLNLELALNKLPPDAGARKNIAEAMQASQRAADISHQMLAYLGQARGKREPVDLGDVCREALAQLPSSLLTATRLTTDFQAQGVIVRADAAQLKRVLTNLAENAGEAIGDGDGGMTVTLGVISAADIHASRFHPEAWAPKAETYACLAIADTGCGMTPEALDRVFDPFFSTKFTGRGLGLPVVMGIVQAHEGACVVESNHGQGTTFRIFLPVIGARPTPIRKAEPVDLSAVEARSLVLVVENEPMLRDSTRAALQDIGYEVLEAADGAAAVELFRQHHHRIRSVLCDATMPQMDGWKTLEALRSLRPDVPVILASGYDEAHVMAGEHPELPQAFLHKPFTSADLKAALAATIADR